MILTDREIKIYKGKICPYCGAGSVYHSTSDFIYGIDYGPIYLCGKCSAWCGCHPGTNKALGRLANKELRTLKRLLHDKYFDPIWKSRKMSRSSAYKWLSESLNIPSKYTHIGMFSESTCKRAIELCTVKLQELNKT